MSAFDGPMFNKPPINQSNDNEMESVFAHPQKSFGEGIREAFGFVKESYSGRDEMVNFAAQAAGMVLSRRPDSTDEMAYSHIVSA